MMSYKVYGVEYTPTSWSGVENHYSEFYILYLIVKGVKNMDTPGLPIIYPIFLYVFYLSVFVIAVYHACSIIVKIIKNIKTMIKGTNKTPMPLRDTLRRMKTTFFVNNLHAAGERRSNALGVSNP